MIRLCLVDLSRGGQTITTGLSGSAEQPRLHRDDERDGPPQRRNAGFGDLNVPRTGVCCAAWACSHVLRFERLQDLGHLHRDEVEVLLEAGEIDALISADVPRCVLEGSSWDRGLLGTDWWPYGIRSNRAAIDVVLRYPHERG